MRGRKQEQDLGCQGAKSPLGEEACRGPAALWEGAPSPDQLVPSYMRRVLTGSVHRQLSAPSLGQLPPTFPACLLFPPSNAHCVWVTRGFPYHPAAINRSTSGQQWPLSGFSQGESLDEGVWKASSGGGLSCPPCHKPGRQWAGFGLLNSCSVELFLFCSFSLKNALAVS